MSYSDLSIWINQRSDLTIPTERENVFLKRFEVSDVDLIFKAIDEDRPHLNQFYDNIAGKYQTAEDVESSILNPDPKQPGRLRFGIWDIDTIVGSVNLTPEIMDPQVAEIGYWIGGKHLRKGYASIAVQALSQFAFFSLDVVDVLAYVVEGNIASQKVLEKNGFEFDGKTVEEKDGKKFNQLGFRKSKNDK